MVQSTPPRIAPGTSLTAVHHLGREDPEGPEVGGDVDDDGQNFGHNAQDDVVAPEGAEAGQSGRDDDPQPQDDEKTKAAAQPRDVIRPIGAGEIPDLGHGEQAGLCQTGGSPQQPEHADDQPDHRAPVESVDVAAQGVPHDGEFAEAWN